LPVVSVPRATASAAIVKTPIFVIVASLKKLTKVSTVTLSTSLDAGYAGSPYGMGYGTTSNYDPDSNTVEAITSLSITYDFGTGVAK
jgi:hypothetical protein